MNLRNMDRRLFMQLAAMTVSTVGFPFFQSKAGATDAGARERAMGESSSFPGGVIFLGMDGLDPKVCARLMADGRLPHFARLAREGTVTKLATSNPPQSPVSWSCIGTSLNPGGHGLYDFLNRDPEEYRIELGVLKFNPRNLLGSGDDMFLPVRKGEGFWDYLAGQGQAATVVRWPIAFPPQGERANLLAGLGVPDIKGGLGRYSFYSDSQAVLDKLDKALKMLVSFKGDRAQTQAMGPMESGITGKRPSSVPLKLRLDKASGELHLQLGKEQDRVKPGSFSQWFRPKFSTGLLSSSRALCRFYYLGSDPFRLYLSPMQVDPYDPVFPICTPKGFSRELAEKVGPYHTLGMPEDTNAIVDGALEEMAFIESCDNIISEQEKILDLELGRFNGGVMANVFFTSDRLQHIFWVTQDPKHPMFSEAYRRQYGHVIGELYQRMDHNLGKVLKTADKAKAAVIACSDHGFNTYRTSVHLNTWLVNNGLMSLKSKPDPSDPDAGALFRHVDWEKTKAYSLGFNGIFLNRQGREGEGIVGPQEAEGVMAAIAKGLAGLQDRQSRGAVAQTYRGERIYHGPQQSQAPDLVVGFAPGFRSSWQTALGGTPDGEVLTPNMKKWTGDHLIDPNHVPGVLATNFPLRSNDPGVLDLAPTIAALLQVKPSAQWEGKSLV